MGVWFTTPALDAGETVKWRKAANRDQNGRAVGGRLFLTEKRLLFRPNRIDSISGGKAWTCELSQIGAVGASPRDGHPFSGGLRPRLRVEMKDAEVERFTVNDLEDVIHYLEAEVSIDGSTIPRLDEARSRRTGPWVLTGLLVVSVVALLLVNIFVLH